MKRELAKIREPWCSIICLCFLFLIKSGLQISLYQQGFISVSADEFARGIISAQWATQPRLDIIADVHGIWLPLEKYLNGLILVVWPDVIWAPRLTAYIFSCFVLIALYLMTYSLFDNFTIAMLAGFIIVSQPWYVWLSGTPMLEMYYFTCLFAGLLFLILWLKEARRGYWFWAGLCFFWACGFHVQSWTITNLVNLLTLPFLCNLVRQKKYSRLLRLVTYYVLSNAFIISFVLIELVSTGQVFAFFTNHTNYSQWFHQGYSVTTLEKLLYYPHLIIEHSSGIIWVFTILALVFLKQHQDRYWKLFPFFVALLALILNSVMNIISGPPSAAPGRYSLFFVLMMSPYVAYGAYQIYRIGSPLLLLKGRLLLGTLSIALLIYGIGWGVVRIPDYPHGMPPDAVEVGRKLNVLLVQNVLPNTNSMIELRYWDSLAVRLTAGHYDNVVFDREYKPLGRDTRSIFERAPDDIYTTLKSQNIQYIVLNDPELKRKAQNTGFLRPQETVGTWTIYKFYSKP